MQVCGKRGAMQEKGQEQGVGEGAVLLKPNIGQGGCSSRAQRALEQLLRHSVSMAWPPTALGVIMVEFEFQVHRPVVGAKGTSRCACVHTRACAWACAHVCGCALEGQGQSAIHDIWNGSALHASP